MYLPAPPEFLEYLHKQLRTIRRSEFSFVDPYKEINNYLKSLYDYEMGRSPIHVLFLSNYRLGYFDKLKMLNYYLDPHVEMQLSIYSRINNITGIEEYYINRGYISSRYELSDPIPQAVWAGETEQ
jgi:hypothetical protein